MNNLKNYQSIFVNDVIFNDAKPNHALLEQMIPIGKLNPLQVIEVYANDYRYRMLEAMQVNFESVWMVLGDDNFQELIFEFIKAYPSSEYDLNLYGTKFPEFLSTKNELLESMPFLVSLANFEIIFWKMFQQKKPQPSTLTPEEIFSSQLIFDDNLMLFESEFNVFPIFQYKDKSLDEFFEYNDPAIINRPAFYLMYKNQQQVTCHLLSKAQFDFFSALRNSTTLIELINQEPDISEVEMREIFEIISGSLTHQLKIALATR